MTGPEDTIDWTQLLAIWGGITGSVALVITFLTYRRDRAHLIVSCSAGSIISGESSTGPWVFLEAVNAGRRPIRLESAGFIAENSPNETLVTFGDLRTFPKTLGESERVSINVSPASIYEHSIGAGKGNPTVGYFTDSLGRRHKTKVPPDVMERITTAGAVANR